MDECDFSQAAGTCTADLKFDQEHASYRVAADGTCRTVNVLIDHTQYAQRIFDRDVEDSVTVFDKTKEISVSVSGCIRHPTKAEVLAKCDPLLKAKLAPCRAQRETMTADCTAKRKADPSFDGRTCWHATQDATQGCYDSVAEAANACVGARAWELYRTDDYIGIARTGEY
jgi:hypothetical protein